MSKKKVGIVAGVVVVAAAATAGVWAYQTGKFGSIGDNGDRVYVASVDEITGNATGAQNRYSGVVEAQETWDLNVDADRTVKEVYVAVGDNVEAGTPLLAYDTDELQGQIESAKLELEGFANDITSLNSQINELSKERDAAAEEDKFEYTTQIQSKQAEIRQTEYSQKSKQAEIDKLQGQIDNSIVTSKIAGIVKTLNQNGSMDGSSEAYLTVLATGDYRVKGTVNEQNIGFIAEGTPVILRSRVDDTLTWSGTVSKIDTQNQITTNNDMYADTSTDTSSTSTKYPFYIKLDTADGLMLGQHLYIEMDEGQTEVKEGMWLYSYYIVQNEGEDPYVWADNGKGKLEKRTVTLGEYDEELDEYQITDGIKEDDLIAWPMEGIYEGIQTVTNADEVDYSSPLYSDEAGSDSAEYGEDGENIDLSGESDDAVLFPEGDSEIVDDSDMPDAEDDATDGSTDEDAAEGDAASDEAVTVDGEEDTTITNVDGADITSGDRKEDESDTGVSE